MKNEPFVIERTYNAPVARVWKAITHRDQMKEWYFDIPEFKAEKDFEFQFTAEDEACNMFVHLCKVIEVIPQKKLKHSWRYEGQEGDSIVTFELFDEGEKTRLKLTHEGLESFPALPVFARESFAAGWTDIIGTSLPDYVEIGTAEKSIDIKANPYQVWDTLTQPEYTAAWAKAFHEGTTVTSSWQKGDLVEWNLPDGSIAAKGVITESIPGCKLKVGFYDNVEDAPPAAPNDYYEIYEITEKGDGVTLKMTSGQLAKKYLKIQGPLWNTALHYIKEIAEGIPVTQ